MKFVLLRRTVLNCVLVCLALSIFAACSENETARSELEAPDKVVRIITWEDYLATDVIKAFTERTGIKVEIDSFENTEELIGTLRAYSHRYDIVILDNSSIGRYSETKLIQPIDLSRLKGLANLDPKFLNTPNDPENKFSIPYLWGSTLVAYRNDKIPDPEHSFELLFDPSVKGKVLLLDDIYESIAVAHLLDGRSINSYDEASLLAATERLKQGVKQNGIKFGSDGDVREALASGEAWVALCYSGDAAFVAEEHPEVSYFSPKEGISLWLDVITISRDARNLDAAYAFIDFMLEPEVAAQNANELWYATPNLLAQPLLDKELVSDKALILSQSTLSNCEFFTPWPVHASAMISKLGREIYNVDANSGSIAIEVPADE